MRNTPACFAVTLLVTLCALPLPALAGGPGAGYYRMLQQLGIPECPPDGGVEFLNAAETEELLAGQVDEMRCDVPTLPRNPQEAEDYRGQMASFDSDLYGNHDILLNFRGDLMLGWELNYYFIGMAFANQGLPQFTLGPTIDLWNWLQAQESDAVIHGSGEVTSNVRKAARAGYEDELVRQAQEEASGEYQCEEEEDVEEEEPGEELEDESFWDGYEAECPDWLVALVGDACQDFVDAVEGD